MCYRITHWKIICFCFSSVQEKFDTINFNLKNLKNYILRDLSALHVKFDKLIDLLIKNQTNSIIEMPQN